MKMRILAVAILATMGVTPAITATLPVSNIGDRIVAQLNGLNWMRGPIGGEAAKANRAARANAIAAARGNSFDVARLPFTAGEGASSQFYLKSTNAAFVVTSLGDGMATVAAAKRAAIFGNPAVSGMAVAGSAGTRDVIATAQLVFPGVTGPTPTATGETKTAVSTLTGTSTPGTTAASGPVSDIPIIFVPLGAVPEPSTWAMLIAGFGTIGLTIRRRRTRYNRISFS
jgi:hypothetical protein